MNSDQTPLEFSKMMSRVSRLSLSLLVLLAAIPFAAGCYTVLRHPEPENLVADDSGSRKACEDCHVDSPFYHDAFDPHAYGFGSYWASPGWSDYYFRPWWYRDYWYYDYGPSTSPGQPVETGDRHMWSAGGRRDLGGGGLPIFPGSTGGGVSGGVNAAAPVTGNGQPSGGNPQPAQTPPNNTTRSSDSYRSTGRRDIGTPNAPKPPDPPPKKDESPEGKPPQ